MYLREQSKQTIWTEVLGVCGDHQPGSTLRNIWQYNPFDISKHRKMGSANNPKDEVYLPKCNETWGKSHSIARYQAKHGHFGPQLGSDCNTYWGLNQIEAGECSYRYRRNKWKTTPPTGHTCITVRCLSIPDIVLTKGIQTTKHTILNRATANEIDHCMIICVVKRTSRTSQKRDGLTKSQRQNAKGMAAAKALYGINQPCIVKEVNRRTTKEELGTKNTPAKQVTLHPGSAPDTDYLDDTGSSGTRNLIS